jgi:hypothetical protein
MPALAYAGGNWVGAWVRYGLQVPVILALLYLPTVRLPGWSARACILVAAATYHIYLFGGFAPELLDGVIGWSLPAAAHALMAVMGGIGLGLALFWGQRTIGRAGTAWLSPLRARAIDEEQAGRA